MRVRLQEGRDDAAPAEELDAGVTDIVDVIPEKLTEGDRWGRYRWHGDGPRAGVHCNWTVPLFQWWLANSLV